MTMWGAIKADIDRARDKAGLVVYPYNSADEAAVQITENKLWGIVPTELALGRFVYMPPHDDNRASNLPNDYFVSRIEALYNKRERKYVVAFDLIAANENWVEALPKGLRPAQPFLSIVSDDPKAEKFFDALWVTNETLLNPTEAHSVPPLGVFRQLYKPNKPEHQTSVSPPARPYNRMTGVRLAHDGNRLRTQARSAGKYQNWEFTDSLSNNLKVLACGS
jgi:hypothetical protein